MTMETGMGESLLAPRSTSNSNDSGRTSGAPPHPGPASMASRDRELARQRDLRSSPFTAGSVGRGSSDVVSRGRPEVEKTPAALRAPAGRRRRAPAPAADAL